MTEPYLEDNRPSLEEVCEEQEECNETCPAYKCCFGNRLKESEDKK